jgi:hypothetical protein
LRREFESVHFLLKETGWVAVVLRMAHPVRIFDLDVAIADDVLRPGLDADERITRDPLPALHGFKQE